MLVSNGGFEYRYNIWNKIIYFKMVKSLRFKDWLNKIIFVKY